MLEDKLAEKDAKLEKSNEQTKKLQHALQHEKDSLKRFLKKIDKEAMLAEIQEYEAMDELALKAAWQEGGGAPEDLAFAAAGGDLRLTQKVRDEM